MSFENILKKIDRDKCLHYSVDASGTQFGLEIVDGIKKQYNSYTLYQKIIKNCQTFEFENNSANMAILSMMTASNSIAKETRRGCGNHCIITKSFLDIIQKEIEIIYSSEDLVQCVNSNNYTFQRYTINVSLPMKSPICIMTYTGSYTDTLDAGIGFFNGELIFNYDWERYFKVVRSLDKPLDDISGIWAMFMESKK